MKKIWLLLVFLLLTTTGFTFTIIEEGYSQDEQGPGWNHVASACPVDEVDLNQYQFTGARLSFKGSATGRIDARCNAIPEGYNFGNRFKVTYQDPDGTGTNYRVRAILYRVPKYGPEPIGSAIKIVVFDSNKYTDTGVITNSVSFSHIEDYKNNAYYVNLIIERKNTAANPMIAIVGAYLVLY